MKGENLHTSRWLPWLREQVANGADLGAAADALRAAGAADADIGTAFEMLRPKGSALVDGVLPLPPLVRRSPSNLRSIELPALTLYQYDAFMTPQECERVIELAGGHLQPSPLTRAVRDGDARTSQTCLLAHLRSPLAAEVDAKICQTLGIRESYGEGIQAQRYDVGQQFKPHYDWFPPHSAEYQRMAGLRGNRTWTFMVYLNDGMEGGGTRFTDLDYTVTPKRGMALLWNNLLDDGSPNMAAKHSGEPVTRGHKIIITKWFRVGGDGPVFDA
jgi:prolyl 4-hydroxylase